MEPGLPARFMPGGVGVGLPAFKRRLGGDRAFSRILVALTVRRKPQYGEPKYAAQRQESAYRIVPAGGAEGEDLFVLPRVQAKNFLDREIFDGAALGPPPPVRRVPLEARDLRDPLWDYQIAAVDFLCEKLRAFPGRAYLRMDTGYGKSRVAGGVIARLGVPALVVVPTDGLQRQWIQELEALAPGLKCGKYDNARRRRPGPETHDVVVVIVNTAREKPPEFFAPFGLVVLDEAHELHSPVNKKVLWGAEEVPAVLGLSATPLERPDQMDRYVPKHLGPPLEAREIPDCDMGHIHFAGRVREVEYEAHPDFARTERTRRGAEETVSAIKTIGVLIEDPCRMRLVAAEVERLYRLHLEPDARGYGLGPRPAEAATERYPEGEIRKHGILVFAEHREYLPALRASLLERFPPEELEVPELDGPARGEGRMPEEPPPPDPAALAAVLRGGAGAADIRNAHRRRIIISTYGYSRRGLSFIQMTAMVLATPRRHGLTQILGRITRRGSDESIVRLVVDIKDMGTSLKNQSTDRRAVYAEKGYPIYRARATHRDFLDPRAPALAGEELLERRRRPPAPAPAPAPENL